MAVAGESAATAGMAGFARSTMGRNFLVALVAAAVCAVLIGFWLWGQQPEYRVLFSNFNDRDGGSIVAELQKLNVPYKYAEGGGAILVPSNMVHDVRLKLAAQGLPKGGNVGFELMENQKLGVSQFHEQVNFQRALEGELARSIQSVAAVQAARVHLALPKPSVFVREQQKPTASVLLNLHSNRPLDQQQVNAIIHLVASSVPDLPPKNVTIVDQSGNLLSDSPKNAGSKGLDATQLKYVQELQQSIVRRVESIIAPIVGSNNVRAEATADVDFSQVEQAAETYKPNQTPATSSVRSQQSSESINANSNPSGVPGALTNQPPAPATAPLTAPANSATAGTGGTPTSSRKDTTINYEVDKTVRYVQQPMGGVKRLSVAVVVNYKKELDSTGKMVSKPLSEAEKAQITDLVREAMGFNKERGDSLNVVNSPFAGLEKEIIAEQPLWKQPENILLAKEAGKYLLAALVLLYIFLRVLKPMVRSLTPVPVAAAPTLGNDSGEDGESDEDDDDAIVETSAEALTMTEYQLNLEMAKTLAKNDPRVVANVIKTWVNGNE